MQNIWYTHVYSYRALTLYILGISWGGWQDMYTEHVVDSVAEGFVLSGLSRGFWLIVYLKLLYVYISDIYNKLCKQFRGPPEVWWPVQVVDP